MAIAEVEAYAGEDDPASHSAPGITKRNEIMFGPPGYSYVYFIYGMYYCLNFVTQARGRGEAVLIRAAEPRDGIELMREQSPRLSERDILAGPGKLCRAFGLTSDHSGLDLTSGPLVVRDVGEEPEHIETSPRIGITKAINREWRFFDPGSSSLSRQGTRSTA